MPREQRMRGMAWDVWWKRGRPAAAEQPTSASGRPCTDRAKNRSKVKLEAAAGAFGAAAGWLDSDPADWPRLARILPPLPGRKALSLTGTVCE